jgi:mannonate dehydratase
MREAWRWFGPGDPVSLDHIRQAGATDVVSSLHHVKIGEPWTLEEVIRHRASIEETPTSRRRLRWSVVESIPVPDDVKRLGLAAAHSVDAWIESLRAVAAGGPGIVCYNFMPLVDWTRTELEHPLDSGATALRFDNASFVAFDVFILQRPGAQNSYTAGELARARTAFDLMSDDDVSRLSKTIVAGLPGSTTESFDLNAFRDRLQTYSGLSADDVKANLLGFVSKVAPIAEDLGVRLALHPDDPPRPLFGLPRVVSTGDDYTRLFAEAPSSANGMCFCTGSLGVLPGNDLVSIVRRFGPRIFFSHLRSTRREPDGLSFYEASHLDGDFDMVAVLAELLREDARRAEADRIVFRPDHGHRMLDDLGKAGNPGYWAIGRLRGLAELRGAIRALRWASGTSGPVVGSDV